MSSRQQAIAVVEEEWDSLAVEAEADALADGRNVALEVEAASAHMEEDMGRTVNVGAGAEAVHYSIAEAERMDFADMDSHRDYTSAGLEGSLDCGCDYGSGCDCGCTASSCPYPAACQTLGLGLALPADDDRSSCRRGRTVGVEAPNRPRSVGWSCAVLGSFWGSVNFRGDAAHSAHQYVQVRGIFGFNAKSGEAMVEIYHQRQQVLSHEQ
jgi:hypothetical protein